MSKKIQKNLVDILFYIVGALLFSFAINTFTVPNNVSGGGITGISIMLNYLFRVPIGLCSLLLNVPLFIWGYFRLGKAFLKNSLIATIITSVMIDFTEPIFKPYTGDLMLASIFGGALSGIGLGLVFMRGATTGGSDLAAGIISKKMKFISVGRLIFLIDAVIVLTSTLVFKQIESALYASIVIFISSKLVDMLIYGSSDGNGKMIFIVSKKSNEITAKITKSLNRGVTLLKGKGAYSGAEIDVIMCAAFRREFFKVESLATEIDPECFIISSEANDIRGEGFTRNDKK